MGTFSKEEKEKNEATRKFFLLREEGYKGPIDQDGNKVTSGPIYDLLMDIKKSARSTNK